MPAVPKPRRRAKKKPTRIARSAWLDRSSRKPIRQVNPEAKARRTAAFKKRLSRADWKALRLACFARDGFRCTNTFTMRTELVFEGETTDMGTRKVRCNAIDDSKTGRGLVADHLTYRRLGHELLSDIRTLCRSCNQRETVSKRENWTR